MHGSNAQGKILPNILSIVWDIGRFSKEPVWNQLCYWASLERDDARLFERRFLWTVASYAYFTARYYLFGGKQVYTP